MKLVFLLAAPAILSAHICPGVGSNYIDTHSSSTHQMTAKEVQKARQNSLSSSMLMKVGGNAGGSQAMSTHDDPIIVEDGSIKVRFGKNVTVGRTSITRHACPGPQVVQLVQWSLGIGKVQRTVTNVVLEAAQPTIRFGVDRKSAGGSYVMAAMTSSPEVTLTWVPRRRPGGADATWKFERQTGTAAFVSPLTDSSGNKQFHFAASSSQLQDVRVGWIPIGSNSKRPLRGCYVLQIYPQGADTMPEADGKPVPVESLNPPCVAKMADRRVDKDVMSGGPKKIDTKVIKAP